MAHVLLPSLAWYHAPMNRDRYLKHTLANGLSIYVVEKPEVATATLMCLYRVGSASESQQQQGAAHLLEHMMFKGSKNFPAGSIDTLVQRLGGENNAFTSRDYTAYYHVVPALEWEKVLDMELDRMTSLNLDPEEFLSERQVVLEEIGLYADDPHELMMDKHFEMAFGEKNPYHHPILGYSHSLNAMSAEDLRLFYRRFYRVDNAAILVVGGVDGQKVVLEVAKRFNLLTTPQNLISVPVRMDGTDASYKPLILAMDVEDVRFKLSFPSACMGETEDIVADLLEEILAGGRSSILWQELKEKRHLASTVGAGNSAQQYTGLFFLDLDVSESASLNDCLLATYAVLDELLQNGVLETDFQRAVNKLLAAWHFEQERSEDMAMSLSQWVFLDRVGQYFSFPEQLEKICLEDVNQFCRRIFRPEAMLLSVVHPTDCALDAPVALWKGLP